MQVYAWCQNANVGRYNPALIFFKFTFLFFLKLVLQVSHVVRHRFKFKEGTGG